MIRLADKADILANPSENVAYLRIASLMEAYGPQPFLRFYTDDSGSMMSLFDGNAVLLLPGGLTEEWAHFLRMHHDIATLRTSCEWGPEVAKLWGSKPWQGITLYSNTSPQPDAAAAGFAKPEAIYEMLQSSFGTLPAFDHWYVDVSHRLRHGNCHVAVIFSGDIPASYAMTVAEHGNKALIGSVATHPDYRKRGLATRCIAAIMNQHPDKTYYIEPKNAQAERLYKSIGFEPYGEWAQIEISTR